MDNYPSSAHVVSSSPITKNLEYFVITKQLTHTPSPVGRSTSWVSTPDLLHAGRLGTKQMPLTHHEDVYPRGRDAYCDWLPAITLVYVQGWSLLHVIVPHSAPSSSPSDHGLQTDPITQSPHTPSSQHDSTKPPSQPRLQQTPGPFHKRATSFTTGLLNIPTLLHNHVWLTCGITRPSRIFISSSIGPECNLRHQLHHLCSVCSCSKA